MAPEDHYRRLVSALSEAGTFEDPQRLYHLGLPSHGMCPRGMSPNQVSTHVRWALAIPGGLSSVALGSLAAETQAGFGYGPVGPSVPTSPLVGGQ